MAAIIELELSPEDFALDETLTTVPEAQIKIERVVADNPDRITPYVWACTDDFDALETALEDDPTVESKTLLSKADGEQAYRIRWSASIEMVVPHITEHEGTITHAEGSATGWQLRALFPDRESAAQAYDAAQQGGYRVDVHTIYDTEDARHIHQGLTDKQHETMVAAFNAGYFNIPREVTLTEFAEQQGLSHQALSERIRRATSHLVESTLLSQNETVETS